MKASDQRAVVAGWYAERFARTKNIQSSPDHWLKTSKPVSSDEGARAVQRMFARMAAKQGE